jgi:citrate synthase
MKKNTVTLIDNSIGKRYEYKILESTRGPSVVDIRSFFADTGMFTYDPGFTSTASCESTITFIDGGKGELRYQGLNIEDLANNHSYMETCFLLLNSRLPTSEELIDFDLEIRHRAFLHDGLRYLFNAFPDNAHPMATLSAAVTALSTFYNDHIEMDKEEEYLEMAHRIISKMPTIAAFAYRHSLGIPFIQPDIDLGFTKNFLTMMRAYPGGKMHLGPNGHEHIKDVEVRALDTIFTLHADHEQNASTTVVRGVASTGAHPYVLIE